MAEAGECAGALHNILIIQIESLQFLNCFFLRSKEKT